MSSQSPMAPPTAQRPRVPVTAFWSSQPNKAKALIKADIKAGEQRINNYNWYRELAQQNNAISTGHISAHCPTADMFFWMTVLDHVPDTMVPMRIHHYLLTQLALAAFTSSIPNSADAETIRSISYVGNNGEESITGGNFLDDGTIVLAGKSTSPQLSANETRLEPGDGFIGWWSQDGSELVRVVRLATVTKLVKQPAGRLTVACGNVIKGISSNGAAIDFTSDDAGATISDLAIAGDGYVVLSGKNLIGFDSVGKIQFRTSINKSRLSALAVDALYAYVAGDENTQTGFEPYRSPYVFRYLLSDGTADNAWQMYNWAGPDVRANGKTLQADSFVNDLAVDPKGQIWLAAGSDGGNTVLAKSTSSLEDEQLALDGACYPGPCFNYRGAKKTGMFARIKNNIAELERATWLVPYLQPKDGRNSPACGCKAPPASPNSATIESLAFYGDNVVAAATSSYRPPESDNAWFRDTIYTGSNSWIGIFDRDLTSVTMATMIPGTKGPAGVVTSGTRLLLFGEATPGTKPTTINPGEESWAFSLPTTSNAQQASFGGGESDGYFLLACVGSDADCAAPGGNNDVDGNKNTGCGCSAHDTQSKVTDFIVALSLWAFLALAKQRRPKSALQIL
jgi:hypothetical protein